MKAVLTALTTLVESEHDGLDRKRRGALSDSILRVLASIDETTASGLLNAADWQTVLQAIELTRAYRKRAMRIQKIFSVEHVCRHAASVSITNVTTCWVMGKVLRPNELAKVQ